MITTDVRFPEGTKMLLASLIGREFEKYRCDELHSEEMQHVWGAVGLSVGGESFALCAVQEPHDFFGELTDIAVTSFSKMKWDEIEPYCGGGKKADFAVGKTIQDILVYEDSQIESRDGADIFEYDFTSAVVFVFDDAQLLIEPDGWIMEMFGVACGKDAALKVSGVYDKLDEEEREGMRVSREVVSLKDWTVRQ